VAIVAVGLLSATLRAEEPAPKQDKKEQDKKAQARAKLVEGDRLLKLGEFQQALTVFKDAYDLYPSPKIRYNFGLAYEGMGRNADALEAFDAFLVEATDASPETRDRAVAARNTLLGRVGTLRVVADVEGAAIVVDGRDMGKTAPARELRLDPGPHLLLVDRGGGTAPFTQRLDVAAGAAVTVVVHLAAPPAVAGAAGATEPGATAPAVAPSTPQPSPGTEGTAPDEGRSWRTAGIVTAAAGAGFLGGGLLFGLAARSASSDVSHRFDASQDSAGRRDEMLQWVGYGVGAAAIATGTWLFFHGRALDSSEAPALQVGVLPGRCFVRGRF
jgi:hypothetical protein